MSTNQTSQEQAAKNLITAVERGDQNALNDLIRLLQLRPDVVREELNNLIHNLIVYSAQKDKKAKDILQTLEKLIPHIVADVRVKERRREFWHLINLAKLGDEEATAKVVQIVKLNQARLEKIIRNFDPAHPNTAYKVIDEANSGPVELGNGKLAHELKEMFLSERASKKQKQLLWTLENCIVNLSTKSFQISIDDEGDEDDEDDEGIKQTVSIDLIPHLFGNIIRRHFEQQQKRR